MRLKTHWDDTKGTELTTLCSAFAEVRETEILPWTWVATRSKLEHTRRDRTLPQMRRDRTACESQKLCEPSAILATVLLPGVHQKSQPPSCSVFVGRTLLEQSS
uniref:Uncharacterized protein n=1 Tax=Schistocephalus solidus TaxID=70667 RepID=A0A0X3P8N4_SCHSO